MRIAFTTPLPPQPSGVAAYSVGLVEGLRSIDGVSVDVYVDGPPHQRAAIVAPSIPARPLASLERVEALVGRYDAVVYSLGNSEFHTGSLALAFRRPGFVLAHDVRLSNLYAFAQWQHPEAVVGVDRMYDGVAVEQAERWGLAMARDVIGASVRFLTTSMFAANMARLDARPADCDRIASVGFGIGPRARPPAPATVPVVASFGVVNRLKHGPLLVEAFAQCAPSKARLVFVGPAGADDVAEIRGRADGLGVGGRVEVTGEVDDAAYESWLAQAWVAVQLRASTNGESSAAIGDCLAAGLPTIVTGIGANRELPPDAVASVPADVDAASLADVLGGLLDSVERRRELGAAAAAFADGHSFSAAARTLYDEMSSSR